MWNIQNTISNLRLRKVFTSPNICCNDLLDDDAGSSSSRDEALECPICFESFNIVENVPYVLWCGHTLCRNCVFGLQWAILKLPAQKIRLPFFISCPWCNVLSLRWVYRGILRYPRKNFFILWMVESLNGERAKSEFSLRGGYNPPVLSPRRSFFHEHSASSQSPRRAQSALSRGPLGSNLDNRRVDNHANVEERFQFLLYKSLDYFIRFASKFPLVIIFLVIIFVVIPASMAVLALYLLVTIILAIPSFLVLYVAYPALDWLLREIAS